MSQEKFVFVREKMLPGISYSIDQLSKMTNLPLRTVSGCIAYLSQLGDVTKITEMGSVTKYMLTAKDAPKSPEQTAGKHILEVLTHFGELDKDSIVEKTNLKERSVRVALVWLVRSKLVKKGTIGYIATNPEMLPEEPEAQESEDEPDNDNPDLRILVSRDHKFYRSKDSDDSDFSLTVHVRNKDGKIEKTNVWIADKSTIVIKKGIPEQRFKDVVKIEVNVYGYDGDYIETITEEVKKGEALFLIPGITTE